MGLTLEITPDLEPLLRAEAEKQGSDPLEVAERVLRTKLLGEPTPITPRLEAEESQLVEAINRGPATEEMERYLQLIRKRQDEDLCEEELKELLDFTKQMEQLAVLRMQNLAALAKLRGVDVEALMEELQIGPPDVLTLAP